MSFAETVLLGALAGFTIFLGLPLGRLQIMGNRGRVALAMFAVGVLAFLFADIFEHALGIVEEPVEAFEEGDQGIGEAIGFVALLGVGFAAGTAGLAAVERWMRPRPAHAPAGGRRLRRCAHRPGRRDRAEARRRRARARALQVGLTIAAAIGLHNFAEGLAIGVSASTGRSPSRPY